MEQYLQTYLKKKYGLKSIVIEQAKSILRSIMVCSDQEVVLFKKVLKHEVDEDLRQKQLELSS